MRFSDMSQTEIDSLISRQRGWRWEGWTLVIHRPNHVAERHPAGKFYNGRWGFEDRIDPNSDGNWRVPLSATTARSVRR